MRALLQRVSSAEVRVGGAVVGAIGPGLLALVGVGAGDGAADAEWVARKLLSLRLFEAEPGRAWTGSVASLGLGVLLVSQFTLHASSRKSKPSFQRALGGEAARPLFDAVVKLCAAERGVTVATGEFGAMMDVALVNNGPVTLWLDSKNPHDDVWGGSNGGGGGGGGGGAGEGEGEDNGKESAVPGTAGAAGASTSVDARK